MPRDNWIERETPGLLDFLALLSLCSSIKKLHGAREPMASSLYFCPLSLSRRSGRSILFLAVLRSSAAGQRAKCPLDARYFVVPRARLFWVCVRWNKRLNFTFEYIPERSILGGVTDFYRYQSETVAEQKFHSKDSESASSSKFPNKEEIAEATDESKLDVQSSITNHSTVPTAFNFFPSPSDTSPFPGHNGIIAIGIRVRKWDTGIIKKRSST